jgi:hypothetical protein
MFVLAERVSLAARLSLELSPQFCDLWVPGNYEIWPDSRFELAQTLVSPVGAVRAKVTVSK